MTYPLSPQLLSSTINTLWGIGCHGHTSEIHTWNTTNKKHSGNVEYIQRTTRKFIKTYSNYNWTRWRMDGCPLKYSQLVQILQMFAQRDARSPRYERYLPWSWIYFTWLHQLRKGRCNEPYLSLSPSFWLRYIPYYLVSTKILKDYTAHSRLFATPYMHEKI